MAGLRGVGKTVLLDQMRKDAEAAQCAHRANLEAPENRSLPGILAPQLRLALLRLSAIDAAKAAAIRGLRALAGFASKLKLSFNDIEVGFDYEAEPGSADNGDLESDLTALLEQVGRAARGAGTVLRTISFWMSSNMFMRYSWLRSSPRSTNVLRSSCQ